MDIVGHTDTENADILGHTDTENADILGHTDTETVDNFSDKNQKIKSFLYIGYCEVLFCALVEC